MKKKIVNLMLIKYILIAWGITAGIYGALVGGLWIFTFVNKQFGPLGFIVVASFIAATVIAFIQWNDNRVKV